MSKNLKSISFEDGYRLGLIAKNPTGVDREAILEQIDSAVAKRIAEAIMAPAQLAKGAPAAGARAAADDLLKLAEKS